MKHLLATLLFVCSLNSHAADLTRPPSQAKELLIQLHNKQLSEQHSKKYSAPTSYTQGRPFAEYEQTKYLFFSVDTPFKSEPIKGEIAKNLPNDTILVLYKVPGPDKDYWEKIYSKYIPPSRLRIIELEKATSGFWSRDGLPIATYNNESSLEFVDAKYYHGFEPDKEMSELFHVPLFSHNYYFEGGNFMPNRLGDCLVVNNPRVKDIPDSIFIEKYSCHKLIRLPFVKGIGHADESVKFIDDHTVLTDTESYIPLLEENGFKVIRLPRPTNNYETYVNSLIVNGTVFVPTFAEPTDEQALSVYKNLGLKVVGINSSYLSNNGMGSIHCITMGYPDLDFHDLTHMLNNIEH